MVYYWPCGPLVAQSGHSESHHSSMKNARDIPWFRLFAEATAIVLSILLAFAIDAWWAERLERNAEREELSRLYDELLSNRDRLNIFVSDKGLPRLRSAALSVYETLDTAIKGGADFALVPDTHIALLGTTVTFEAETAVYDGLIRSGRIEIVRDRDIVNAMAKWERHLRSVSEVDMNLRRFVDQQLLPALAEHSSIQHVLLLQGQDFLNANRDSEAVTKIPAQPFIVNLVALRNARTMEVIDDMTALRDDADNVMSAISVSLGQ